MSASFACILMLKRKKSFSRYSIDTSEEGMQDRMCQGFLKKFGWCTMEVGKDNQRCRILKEYLKTKCNKGSGVEDGDLLPNSAKDRLVSGVSDGILQLRIHLPEGGGEVDGEDTLNDSVVAAFEDQSECFVEDLLCIFDDTTGRAFVEVVAGSGGLAEETGELLGLGFEFSAVLFADAGFAGGFDDLVC